MECLFRWGKVRIALVRFLVSSLVHFGRPLPLGKVLSLGWLAFLPAAGLPFTGNAAEAADSQETVSSGICPLLGGGCQNGTGLKESEKSFEKSVFRVIHSYRSDGGMMYADKGSGVLIENREGKFFVLSAAHVFNGKPGAITLVNRSGFRTEGTLRIIDRNWDIALLEMKDIPDGMPVRFAREVPKVGDSSRIAGFGSDNHLAVTRGEAVGYTKTAKTDSYETLKTSGAVRQGDSGGPVFNDTGELVGIVWGTDGSCSYATYIRRIEKILTGNPELGFVRDEDDNKSTGLENEDKNREQLPIIGQEEGEEKHRILSPQRDDDKGNRHKAENVLLGNNPDAAERVVGFVLKTMLPALGVAVPSSVLTFYTCWRVLHRVRKLRKRNRKRRESVNNNADNTANKEKKGETVTLVNSHNDYAQELNDLYDLNGRNSVADATLGRLYDTELAQAESSSDELTARFAQKLRQKMKKELCRIHSEVPVPVSENGTNN